MRKNIISFNEIINILNKFWIDKGCIILQPFDNEIGAATFHPCTFFNSLTDFKYKAAYTQICRRPFDFQRHLLSNKKPIFHQYQVIIKPYSIEIKDLYLESLSAIGIDIYKNDIRFIEDNWNSPTLGASGIGWEVRLNGIEITQFTYFQKMGSFDCNPITVELAYGLERLALQVQNILNIDDIIIHIDKNDYIYYKNLYSKLNFDYEKYVANVNISKLEKDFNKLEKKIKILIKKNLIYMAYNELTKLANLFNIIDVKIPYGFLRQNYVFKIKNLSKEIAFKFKNEQ